MPNLSELTTNLTINILEKHCNIVGTTQRNVLLSTATHILNQLDGSTVGRFAYPLPTGYGKTSLVLALATAIQAQGLQHSLAIAAEKVETICDLKRSLLSLGLLEESIGILHSRRFAPDIAQSIRDGDFTRAEEFASEASNDSLTSKQFVLITHERFKREQFFEQCFQYRNAPRSLLIYDESYISFRPVCIAMDDLKLELQRFQSNAFRNATFPPIATYLGRLLDSIPVEHVSGITGAHSITLAIPPIPTSQEQIWKTCVEAHKNFDSTKQLLQLAGSTFRLMKQGNQVFLVNNIQQVDSRIPNIAILDASANIRELVKLDSNVQIINTTNNSVIKNYANVHLKHLMLAGGRQSIENDAARRSDEMQYADEIANIFTMIPEDERVLLITYKDSDRLRLSFKLCFLNALQDRGVDVSRIDWVTWGNHTSSNRFAYNKHVIVLGVYRLSHGQLATSYLGSLNDLCAEVPPGMIEQVKESEMAHALFQAISRGNCRHIDVAGNAGEMTIYLIDNTTGMVNRLRQAMPNLEYSSLTSVADADGLGTLRASFTNSLSGIFAEFEGDGIVASRRLNNRLFELLPELNRVHRNTRNSWLTDVMCNSENLWYPSGRSWHYIPSEIRPREV